MTITLTSDEQAMLAGDSGSGVATAMRLMVRIADVMGATHLRPIIGAHIDSCLYHGQSGLDFVNLLADGGASVIVPTTLNVSSLDLLHPELYRGDPQTGVEAKALMDAYVSLGCEPTWTCAPYQLEQRPALGDHVAWAESNAIVFANSVLGARTHRYGDFIDIAAAVTGRVPDAGLHTDEARYATMIIDVSYLPERLLSIDALFPVLGHHIGRTVGRHIPAIIGLPSTTSEDQLKALGAGAASSGSLAMFHAIGITPEAATLQAACGDRAVTNSVAVTTDDLATARDQLSTATDGTLATISLGTPHYSITEIGRLVEALAERPIHNSIRMYVSTGRDILNEAGLRGWTKALETAGVQFVTDTCTYITPIIEPNVGIAMTDSAKWAYYAPGNIGVDVVFGALQECVESAVAGHIVRLPELWADA